MLTGYHTTQETKTLNRIKKEYGETFLDGSFQRYGGVERGSGWSKEQSQNYMGSLIASRTCNQIIRAEVSRCLQFAKDHGDKQSIEYFSNVQEKGYRYVSIDGNNTTSTVNYFLNNDLTATDPDTKEEKFLNEFNDDKQEEIQYEEKIRVLTLREISYENMCHLFRHLNTSVSLNAQEYRQAMPTKLSEFIREVCNFTDDKKSQRKFWKYFIYRKPKELDKRFHEEITAQLCLKIKSGFFTGNLACKELDSLYEKENDLTDKVKNLCKTIFKEVDAIANKKGMLKKPLSKGLLHNLFDMVQLCDDRGFKIKDHSKFFDFFLNQDAEWTCISSNVIEDELEEKSYTYWTKFFGSASNYKNIRYLLEESLSLNYQQLLEKEIISYKRTSKDSYSFEDQKILYTLQNARDRKGAKIKIIDLYLGKYEVDHMKSVHDGGKTDLANSELMTEFDNRSKGSNSNKPCFEHQKIEKVILAE